jgi:hypothetical protein
LPTQTFTSSGTWNAPSNLAGPPDVQVWGPGGAGAGGSGGSNGGGGGGGGAFAEEPSLGGVTAGVTTLTITLTAGSATTVTGGSVTVSANSGSAGSGSSGGAGGTTGSNTNKFAGGAGGASTHSTSQGGGGGGGSASTVANGGAGGNNSGATGGSSGTGTGAGGAGGTAGGAASAGNAGTVPGGGGGGGADSGTGGFGGGTGAGGQVIITWTISTTTTGSFALAPLAFSASGSAVTTSSGSFSLAPLHFSSAGSVSALIAISGGLLNIAPGPTWLDLYKPGLPRPRPPSPAPATKPNIGSITLGSLAFSGAGAVQNLFIFIGHYSVSYPDYVDANTQEILSCLPQHSYRMYIVGFRAGLTDPPSDGRWQGVPGIGDEIIFIRRHDILAIARAHNATLQAVNAAKPYPQSGSSDIPQPRDEAPKEPSEHSKIMAAGRAVNAELQARMARGEKI